MLDLQTGQMSTAAGAVALTAAGSFVTGGTRVPASTRTFHQVLVGTGALTCSYVIEASNDGGATWVPRYSQPAMNGNTSVTDGYAQPPGENWATYRVRVVAITGTSASFSSWVAEQRS